MSSKAVNLRGPKDIVIPIMGPTGAGKSTFINIALGREVTPVGHSTTSCTEQPLPIIVDPIPIPNRPELKGCRLVLLDTPGFDDTHEEDVEILKRIAKWLEDSRRKDAIIGGVLYFHDISAKRFTGTARQSLLMFSRLCGEDAIPKTVLVTTNWPSDPNVILEQREDEMKGEHWRTLIALGLNVCRFERSYDSAWKIIGHLQGISSVHRQQNNVDNRLDLQIQSELVDHRMAIPETAAGQELRYTLKQLLKLQREAVALEESFARTGDRDAQTNLVNMRATIGKLQGQVKDLKMRISFQQRFWKFFKKGN